MNTDMWISIFGVLNLQIRMLSEGSRDTEDWFSFSITGINYIRKYFKIEFSSFQL